MKYSLLIIGLLFSQLCFAKILVLEHQDFDTEAKHGEKVTSIACKDDPSNCILQYSESLVYLEDFKMHEDSPSPYDSKDFFKEVNLNLQNSTVVNISIGFQNMTLSSRSKIKHEDGISLIKKDFSSTTEDKEKAKLLELLEIHKKKYQDLIDQENSFKPRVDGFVNLVNNNPKHLFVIASGNGAILSSSSPVNVGGVGLSHDKSKYKVYPAMIDLDNTIKVAAIDENNNIAKYSNYSLDLVDVAANVEESPLSKEPLSGTSYATPKVSRIADKILKINPSLTPKQVKEIIIKTCDVKNIEAAIKASIDLNINKKESKAYQAMYNRKRRVRNKLQKELGSILLVKSGGTVNEANALECAKLFKTSGLSIESTCLKVHRKIQQKAYIQKLKVLWSTRNL